MIKKLKRALCCIAFLATCMQASAEYIPTKVYIYGFCASFNDSTVYFTDVMELDSAWVERKARFLYSRDNYALQLKEKMKQMGVLNPTCVVSFAFTKKDIDKKLAKMRSKYTKPGKSYNINTLTESIFKFEVISAADDYAATHKETKEEKKIRKAETKAKEKEAKAKKKAKKKEIKDRNKQKKQESKEAAKKEADKKKANKK